MSRQKIIKSSMLFIPFVWIWVVVSNPVKDPVSDAIHRKIETLQSSYDLNASVRIYNTAILVPFYRDNDYNPLWVHSKQVNDFMAILRNARADGLVPSDYHITEIARLMNRREPDSMATRDILMSDALLLYADHIKTGKVDSTSLVSRWSIHPTSFNPVRLLQRLETTDVPDLINGLRHHSIEYLRMRDALATYRLIRDMGGWKTISMGKSIRPGSYDPRIPQIRTRLIISGDMDSTVINDADFYDYDLQAGVVHFQRRNGLTPDGIIGNNTVETMNIPVTTRIDQLRINMERQRWLPDDPGRYYIVINIANFDLQVVKNHRDIDHHKVIIGRFYRRTPVFSSKIEYLIFNPDWTVPPTILKKDLIPSIRRHAGILKKDHISVYGPGDKLLRTDTINWNNGAVFKYTYRQSPGNTNPLGAVKFVFPNSFNVYLHDTPSKYLFNNHVRMYSSGCIRVNDALELAQRLLDNPGNWTKDDIHNIVKSGKTVRVPLEVQPRIYVEYFTAWADSDGTVEFRNDIYKRDRAVLTALNQKPDPVTVR